MVCAEGVLDRVMRKVYICRNTNANAGCDRLQGWDVTLAGGNAPSVTPKIVVPAKAGVQSL